MIEITTSKPADRKCLKKLETIGDHIIQGPGSIPAGLSLTPGLNLYDFVAQVNPTPCIVDPSWNVIGSLDLSVNGEYDIVNNFDALSQYPSGTTDIAIHVEANFKNGESIDECQSHTLIHNNPNIPGPVLFSKIVANIRGDIEDYDGHVTNYKVTVYRR